MSDTKTRNPMTICGFCNDGNHELCPHAIRNGNKGLWFCNCARPECGGKILSCIDCKKVHSDVTPGTRQCVDKDACNARMEASRQNNPYYLRVVESTRRANMAKQEENKTKAEKKAKTGICKCGCEGVTKGGNFLPGHDARFVSEQVGHVLGKNKTEKQARSEVAAVSEVLAAKFDKSIGLRREQDEKRAAAAKAKADAKATADAEKKAAAEAKKAETAKAKADAKA